MISHPSACQCVRISNSGWNVAPRQMHEWLWWKLSIVPMEAPQEMAQPIPVLARQYSILSWTCNISDEWCDNFRVIGFITGLWNIFILLLCFVFLLNIVITCNSRFWSGGITQHGMMAALAMTTTSPGTQQVKTATHGFSQMPQESRSNFSLCHCPQWRTRSNWLFKDTWPLVPFDF